MCPVCIKGTDEKGLVMILANRTLDQRKTIAFTYQLEFKGEDLLKVP